MNNYGGYNGPGWGGVAAGAAAGVALGAAIASLPATAQPVIINNQTYYNDGGNYYRPCYDGADVSYCSVPYPGP